MATQEDARQIALALPGVREDPKDFAFDKATLLGADPEAFFTEPHYNGFPAVLVRLKKVKKPMLRKLIAEAHRCQLAKKK